MPPKASKAPKVDDDLQELERKRLRRAAEQHVLQKPRPSTTNPTAIPLALRRSNGSDITKKSSTRKKRYLVLLPGGLSASAGARVGTLEGLSTRTPTLTVTDTSGRRVVLHGALIFPRNALVALRAVRGTKANPGNVKVSDSFDTVIVFSEWSADDATVAGQKPASGPSVWGKSSTSQPMLASSASPPHSQSQSAVVSLDDDESDAEPVWREDKQPASATPAAARTTPRRQRRVINYSSMQSDSDADGDNDDDDDDDKPLAVASPDDPMDVAPRSGATDSDESSAARRRSSAHASVIVGSGDEYDDEIMPQTPASTGAAASSATTPARGRGRGRGRGTPRGRGTTPRGRGAATTRGRGRGGRVARESVVSDDDYDSDIQVVEQGGDSDVSPARPARARRGKPVNYSQLVNGSSSGDAGEGSGEGSGEQKAGAVSSGDDDDDIDALMIGGARPDDDDDDDYVEGEW